jgi:hypothetical protein
MFIDTSTVLDNFYTRSKTAFLQRIAGSPFLKPKDPSESEGFGFIGLI